MFWYVLLGLIVIFTAYLCYNAIVFKPHAEIEVQVSDITVDEEKAVSDLREMIRCKTVSSHDSSLVDENEFLKFKELLKSLYPNVHKKATLEYIGKTGILYMLKGLSDTCPSVFMSHYDVVPANAEMWEQPPFEGVISEGVLWGRGTLDTKITLCGVMSACENILKNDPDFTPENDMYFAFSGDEEIAGPTAPGMVEILSQRGVKPALVVDEGGAVVEGIFPGVKKPCALVGISEKGMADVKFSIDGQGGHASAPPAHTSVGLLARAVCRVESKPFKKQMNKAVSEMFDILGRHSNFIYRVVFANLWLFMPLLDNMCKKKGGELNGLIRTTCAFTQMEASKASKVIPPSASVVANMRLAGLDTLESCLSYLRNTVKDDRVNISLVQGMNPSKVSKTGDDPAWIKLKSAIAQTWPEAIISPYNMIACSDSRHYCKISENVYRFSAAALTTQERASIHGNNERIPVDKIIKTVQFYYRLLKSC